MNKMKSSGIRVDSAKPHLISRGRQCEIGGNCFAQRTEEGNDIDGSGVGGPAILMTGAKVRLEPDRASMYYTNHNDSRKWATLHKSISADDALTSQNMHTPSLRVADSQSALLNNKAPSENIKSMFMDTGKKNDSKMLHLYMQGDLCIEENESKMSIGGLKTIAQQIVAPESKKVLAPMRNVRVMNLNTEDKDKKPLDMAAGYKELVQNQVRNILSQNDRIIQEDKLRPSSNTLQAISQSRQVHPSALGLLASQAIASGGQLKRKGIVVRKRTFQTSSFLANNQSKDRALSPKKRMKNKTGQINSRYAHNRQNNNNNSNLSASSSSIVSSQVSNGNNNYGTAQNKPVTSLKGLTTGKAIENLKLAAKRQQASVYGQLRPPGMEVSRNSGQNQIVQQAYTQDNRRRTDNNTFSSEAKSPRVDIVVTSHKQTETEKSAYNSPMSRRTAGRFSPLKTESQKVLHDSGQPYSKFFQLQKLQVQKESTKMEQAQHQALTAMQFQIDKVDTEPNSVTHRNIQVQADSQSDMGILFENYPSKVLDAKVSFNMGSTLPKYEQSSNHQHHTETNEDVEDDQNEESFDNKHITPDQKISIESEETDEAREPKIKPLSPEVKNRLQLKSGKIKSSKKSVNTTQLPRERDSQISQTPENESPRSSFKKPVLSLYAINKKLIQHKSDDSMQMSQKDGGDYPSLQKNINFLDIHNNINNNNVRDSIRIPLSTRYANLIANARHEISQDAHSLNHRMNGMPMLQYSKQLYEHQQSLKKYQQQKQQQQYTESTTQQINILYSGQSSGLVDIPKEKVVALQTQTSQIEEQDQMISQRNSIAKKQNIEQAKRLLKLQTVWNHNMKNERLSSKKRKNMTPVGFSTLLQSQNANQTQSQQPFSRNQNGVTQLTDYKEIVARQNAQSQSRNMNVAASSIWSLSRQNAAKERSQAKKSKQRRSWKNSPTKQQPSSLPKLIMPNQSQENNEPTERVQSGLVTPRMNRFSKVPLLSDPIKTVKSQADNGIDPKSIFQGKKKNRRNASQALHARSVMDLQNSNLGMNMHRHNRSQIGILAHSSISARASIENVITPQRNTLLPQMHSASQSMSMANNSQMLSKDLSSVALLHNSNKKIIKHNFREQQQRLRELIKKRNALNHQYHQSTISSPNMSDNYSQTRGDHHSHQQQQELVLSGRGSQKTDNQTTSTVNNNNTNQVNTNNQDISSQLNQEALSSGQGQVGSGALSQSGVDAPCLDDRCGYCSSNGDDDSIFDEEANQLSDRREDGIIGSDKNLASSKRGGKVHSHKHHGKKHRKKNTKRIQKAETDLLVIRQQPLNQRPSPRPNQDRTYRQDRVDSYNEEDEVERHSIAVDMRTMQEMHESLNEQSWQYPMATLTKNLQQRINSPHDDQVPNLNLNQNYAQQRENAILSPLKRQTQSTLFNQYNLPDYMLQSPTRLGKKKASNGSQIVYQNTAGRQGQSYHQRNKDNTPNQDLAHIEEKVSNISVNKFNSAKLNNLNKKGGKIGTQTVFNKHSALSLTKVQQSQPNSTGGFTRLNLASSQEDGAYSQNNAINDGTYTDQMLTPRNNLMNQHQLIHLKTQYVQKAMPALNSHLDEVNNHNHNGIIDQEALLKITLKKAMLAKELQQDVTNKLLAGQLQPSRSGFFGPGSATSQGSSQKSLLRFRQENIVDYSRNNSNNKNGDSETPLQQLISRASQKAMQEQSEDQQNELTQNNNNRSKKRPPQIIVPKAHTTKVIIDKQSNHHQSSFESENARLKALYRGPPRSQIGSQNHLDSPGRSSKAGVGGSNLLHKKGVHVGGGGIIGQKPAPFLPIQLQTAIDDFQDAPIETRHLMGYSVRSNQQAYEKSNHERVVHQLAGNSILDSNQQIYKKAGSPAKKALGYQNQNNDLEGYVPRQQQTGTISPKKRSITQSRESSIKVKGQRTNHHYPQLHQNRGAVKRAGGGAMRITGYGVQSMLQLAKKPSTNKNGGQSTARKSASSSFNNLAALDMNNTQISQQQQINPLVNQNNKKREATSQTPDVSIPSVHIKIDQNGEDGNDGARDDILKNNDSLYITLTGKESISDDIPSEYYDKPQAKAVKVVDTDMSSILSVQNSNLPKIQQINFDQMHPESVNDYTQEPVSGRDAQTGVMSLSSSYDESSQHNLLKIETNNLLVNDQINTIDQLPHVPLLNLGGHQDDFIDNNHESGGMILTTAVKSPLIQVSTRRYPFGTIELGEGDTMQMLESQQNNNQYSPMLSPKQLDGEFREEQTPDLTIHGQSVVELQTSAQEKTIGGGLYSGSSRSKLHQSQNKLKEKCENTTGLSIHKSQDSLNYLLQNIDYAAPAKKSSFEGLLKIHAYQQAKPMISKIDSKSTIMEKTKDDREMSENATPTPVLSSKLNAAQGFIQIIKKPKDSGNELSSYDGVGPLNNFDQCSSENASPREYMLNRKLPYDDNNYNSQSSSPKPTKINLRVVTSASITSEARDKLDQLATTNPSALSLYDGAQMSLHDQEEQHKNLNVHQEIKTSHDGPVTKINTVNTMEMYNSTIMKIVVTQKKVNLPTSSSDCSCQGSPNSQNKPLQHYAESNAIFGNSVLINGIAMTSNKHSHDQKGIIRVGRGVGVTGKKIQHGTRSRQATMGKFQSQKTSGFAQQGQTSHVNQSLSQQRRKDKISLPSGAQGSSIRNLSLQNQQSKQSHNKTHQRNNQL